MTPNEPTPEQCSANTQLPDFNDMKAFACWYPQMGGYVGKCVVVSEPKDGCFEAYVWHDGEFPFSEVVGSPARIHHCCAQQFVDFGNLVMELQNNVKCVSRPGKEEVGGNEGKIPTDPISP